MNQNLYNVNVLKSFQWKTLCLVGLPRHPFSSDGQLLIKDSAAVQFYSVTLMILFVYPGCARQTCTGTAREGHHCATSAEGFGREGTHGGGRLKLYMWACAFCNMVPCYHGDICCKRYIKKKRFEKESTVEPFIWT